MRASLTVEVYEQLIYFLVFDIFLSVTAFLGNALILSALRKESSIHPPSKLLYRCLATTDLCVGLIAQPLGITKLMFLVPEKWNLCRYALDYAFIVSYALSGVSLLTMTAISVDRLLALKTGLRYKQVVTLKRTYAIVVSIWIVSIVAATSCLANHLITLWSGYIALLLCVVTSGVSYSKIFHTLCHQQSRVQAWQPSRTVELNIARYRKVVSSALWVQLVLVVCYLPYGIMSASFRSGRQTPSDFLAWELTMTLVYLN